MDKWTKWYKEKSGKTWEDGEYPEFLKSLSEKDRATAKTLYDGYLKDKETLKKAADKLDEEAKKLEVERVKDQAAKAKVESNLKERLLAEGKLDEVKLKNEEGKLKEKFAENDKERELNAAYKTAKTAATANDKVAIKGESVTVKAEEDRIKTQAREEREYYLRLEGINKILKSASTVRDDGRKYYASGKKQAKDYLKGYQRELGDKYDELVAYVDALPNYSTETDSYVTVSTRYGNVKVLYKDLSYLDAVRYHDHAGMLVIKGEVYYATYGGNTYKLKSGNAQSPEMNALLDALATKADLKRYAGATLYYQNKLYVNTGTGDWREVVSPGSQKDAQAYEDLMKMLKDKYDSKRMRGDDYD